MGDNDRPNFDKLFNSQEMSEASKELQRVYEKIARTLVKDSVPAQTALSYWHKKGICDVDDVIGELAQNTSLSPYVAKLMVTMLCGNHMLERVLPERDGVALYKLSALGKMMVESYCKQGEPSGD